jgi:hypothetical protein
VASGLTTNPPYAKKYENQRENTKLKFQVFRLFLWPIKCHIVWVMSETPQRQMTNRHMKVRSETPHMQMTNRHMQIDSEVLHVHCI